MSTQASSSKASPAYFSPDNDDFDDAELYDSDDNKFDDWVEEEENKPCLSLFGPEKMFESLEAALEDTKKNTGVDLGALCSMLELDFYDRMRLVNFLRKQRPTPDVVAGLTGREPFFSDDAYLIPAIEDDPLLHMPQDDAWSDDDDTVPKPASAAAPSSSQSIDPSRELRRANRAIRSLQQQLSQARQDLVDYKGIVNKTLGVSDVKQWVEMKTGGEGGREDPQYFDAYEDVADDANLEI
ncbi:hypothetical protein CALCODRAFT_517588 [Calocera cornea HHB12733]|uniref:type I protein arginine methyltransferase n=1 Tax=Calocera cornea HHB12733 TaxID=1353952 RepID=A0A165FVK4_9BASI|nr:hypothetical protein CALCODRAFT_517588 [Calocera cornea HHB12733]